MTDIKQKIKQEVDRFQTIVSQYQNHQIKHEDLYKQFAHLGIYPQTEHNQFTLRLFSLCGILTLQQLMFFKNLLQEHQIEHIHFTTGQNIHLHNLTIEKLTPIILSALEQDLFSGTVEKLPLHIGLSPLSGVSVLECFDPTYYAKFISDYFANANDETLQNTYKIAFSNSKQDTAFATVSDVGFVAAAKKGKPMFRLYLAGGMHKTILPAIAYPELIEPNEVLLYTLAYIKLAESLATDHGKPCAILQDMGQTFLSQYQNSVQAMRLKHDLPAIRHTPTITQEEPFSDSDSPELNIVLPQKQQDLYCLKIHPANGLLRSNDFAYLVESVQYYKTVEARLGFQSDLYIRNLTLEQANVIAEDLKAVLQQSKVEQSVSCTGLPKCPNGKARSQELRYKIVEYLNQKQISYHHLPRICISGCENGCTRHHISHIGFEGKTITYNNQSCEAYDVYIGGKVGSKTSCGKFYGIMLASQIPEFVYQLALILQDAEMDFPVYYHSNTAEFDAFIKPFLFA